MWFQTISPYLSGPSQSKIKLNWLCANILPTEYGVLGRVSKNIRAWDKASVLMCYLGGAIPGWWKCRKREKRQGRMGSHLGWCVTVLALLHEAYVCMCVHNKKKQTNEITVATCSAGAPAQPCRMPLERPDREAHASEQSMGGEREWDLSSYSYYHWSRLSPMGTSLYLWFVLFDPLANHWGTQSSGSMVWYSFQVMYMQ